MGRRVSKQGFFTGTLSLVYNYFNREKNSSGKQGYQNKVPMTPSGETLDREAEFCCKNVLFWEAWKSCLQL